MATYEDINQDDARQMIMDRCESLIVTVDRLSIDHIESHRYEVGGKVAKTWTWFVDARLQVDGMWHFPRASGLSLKHAVNTIFFEIDEILAARRACE